jgi:hypothetical protein
MKYGLIGIAVLGLMACTANAAQDTTLTQRQVRDPRQLEVILEANATDTETRVAALEGGSTVGSVEPGYIIVGNASTVGVDVVVSGDLTMANDGTAAIASGVIINADVKSDAAIVYSKLDISASVAATDLVASVADRIAYITVVGADLASAGTGTITVQLKDAAGSDLAARALIRTWIGTADDFGVDALTDYSITTGVEKEEVTANGEYLAITDATGLVLMAIDGAGGAETTVYAWAEVGGRIVASGEVVLTAP